MRDLAKGFAFSTLKCVSAPRLFFGGSFTVPKFMIHYKYESVEKFLTEDLYTKYSSDFNLHFDVKFKFLSSVYKTDSQVEKTFKSSDLENK